MTFATLRTATGTVAVRVEGSTGVELPEVHDVGELLRSPRYAELIRESGRRHDLASADFAPVIPRPGKIVCVGLNYREHLREMGREFPEYPTLFTKFPEALIGANDPIELPAASDRIDWEGELAVVVGRSVRHVDPAAAATSIAGYAVLNDVTARDYQYRTTQWLQGKTFEATTPFGPYLVPPERFDAGALLRTVVNGDVVQSAPTDALVFSPAQLISYISAIVTLHPGDVIATGTPGGVGHARKPPRYLTDGDVLTTEIAGLGTQTNAARKGS